jgi:small-conductance mechanosensitive channel
MFQEIMQYPFWDKLYFGNTVFDYTVMFLSFFVFLILLQSVRGFILERLHRLAAKTETDLDDLFVKVIGSLRAPFYAFLAAYLASHALSMNGFFEKLFTAVLVIWVTYQAIVAVEICIDYIINKRDEDQSEGNSAAMHLISIFLKTLIWIFALLMALSNLGVNVTSLVAGLGIGGIAVALAAQNVLGDLFSSFAIYLDRPFVVGDSIKVGETIGTVEKIGIKTTRVRAQQGEEVIFPNKDIASAQIHNMIRMKERRVAFSFGVTYETHDEKLKQIPSWIQEIVGREENTRFDRAHFKEFGDSSLEFEAVYFVTSPDILLHMNARQNINLGLRDKFKQEGVHMAYPTRTIHIRNA